MKSKTAIQNVSYTLTSNLISFIISAVVTFFVPKALGLEDYGYFQLYIFYTSYTGFLYFGWGDGIYLRYGGAYYDKLDRAKINGQFWGIIAYGLLVFLFLLVIAHKVQPNEKSIVITYTGLYILIMWPKTIFLYILQCTNRIKEYSYCVILERVSYLIIVVTMLFTGLDSFGWVLKADLVGRVMSLCLTILYCRDIATTKPEEIKDIIQETWVNLSVGIKLTLSNIASMLIIGIVRYAIELHWDISTFGKVSLSLSVSNMLMVFVNAVALVMFPMLRRIDEKKYAAIYSRLRTTLMVILLGMLIIYYPVRTILVAWLPQYSDGLAYMAILFPLCVFESKNTMLVSTYLKTLRQEVKLLLINVISLILSLVFTVLSILVLDNLTLAIGSILISIAFRCIAGELIVGNLLNINVIKDIIYELVMVATFVITSWFIGGVKGALIYLLLFCIYLFLKRNDVIEMKNFLKLRS